MSRSPMSFTQKSSRLFVIPIAVVLLTFSTPLTANAVFDDSMYEEKIKTLESEIGQYQGETTRLQGQADTLQNKISTLTNQTKTLEAQIGLNEAKQEQLQGQIAENQVQLESQKNILADTLGKLYVDSSVSSIEIIAGSKTIGDFMDKQQYQSGIRDKMKSSIKKVKSLRQELDGQKRDVERIVEDQKSRKELLAVQKAEQAKLLEQTRGEEAQYQNLIGQRNGQVESVKAEQAAAFAEYERKFQEELRRAEEARLAAERAAAASASSSAGGNSDSGGRVQGAATVRPIGNTYPARWANAEQDSLVDSWGMYNRECVSYTAWKVHESGRYMPYWGGRGNAYEWPGNARAAGIPVSSSPSVGSVAVWGLEDIGGVGHTAYVEAVYGDGSILISQYNWGVMGGYTEMRLPASIVRTLDYIHF